MLRSSVIDHILPILLADAKRALTMKVRNFPRPYYCSFLLKDVEWFNTWAASGSTFRERSERTRKVFCDLRVGSYRNDQVSEGGLRDNDEETESASLVSVPIDDQDFRGLRFALWKLSEAKFREALSDYSSKEAQRVSKVDIGASLASFRKLPPVRYIERAKPEPVDRAGWVKFCKTASKWLSDLPRLTGSWVDFESSHETSVFVNTEERLIVQHVQIFTLSATLRHLTKDGAQLEQEVVINAGSLDELPSLRQFKALLREKHDRLLVLSEARRLHSFSGPVLLMPRAAGLLFHEALGHRLEGTRLLSSSDGHTFRGQVNRRVVQAPLTIRDDPTAASFENRKCIGAFRFDDEGAEARNALLITSGSIVGFLTTRAELPIRDAGGNGHARNKSFQRPISRMGITIVEGEAPVPEARLRELLLQEIRDQNKPFGLIVYDVSGGETETTTYDFQAFAGEIAYATLVYPDGREECVRGIDFVGTPLQALNNIIAVGDRQELDNSFCGAESGMVPVSTISPAVLLSDLELQAKDEELVTQYILPMPQLASGVQRRAKKKRPA